MTEIKVQPKFRPLVWGNWKINELFNVQSELPIGEVWLLSGHQLYETTMENGMTINEYGTSIYDGKYPKFPLLIKLVSTNQWLSVQVHPDDAFARETEHELGKERGLVLLKMASLPYVEDVETMKELITQDRLSQLKDILTFVKVKKGTFVYIPAGTVHALGPNSTVVEVQQTSDLTYRIYDWGRPREVHLRQGIASFKTGKNIRHRVRAHQLFKDTVFHHANSGQIK